MKKAKFKVGEKVVIFKSGEGVPNFTCWWISRMNKHVGATVTVESVDFNEPCNSFEYRFVEVPFWWDERVLKSTRDLIVIYRDDMNVVALNKNTGEKGVAHCGPEDKFDFDVGAKIAFCRLYGKEPELVKKMKEKECKTFKALCLRAEIPTESLDLRIKKKAAQPFFCAGKVYEVKYGTITDEEGYTWGGSIDSIEDLNSHFRVGLGYNASFVKVGDDWT